MALPRSNAKHLVAVLRIRSYMITEQIQNNFVQRKTTQNLNYFFWLFLLKQSYVWFQTKYWCFNENINLAENKYRASFRVTLVYEKTLQIDKIWHKWHFDFYSRKWLKMSFKCQ